MRRSALFYLFGVMGLSLVLALAGLASLITGVALRLFAADSYWVFSAGDRLEFNSLAPTRGGALLLTFALVTAALLLYGIHRARLSGQIAVEPAEVGPFYETYLQFISAVLLVMLVLASVLTLVGLVTMLTAPDLPRGLVELVPGSGPQEMPFEAARARFLGGLITAVLFGGVFLAHRRRLRSLPRE